MSHPFAASRVTYDHDAIQVDPAMQRVRGDVVPGPKLLEMLQVHDRSRVILAEVAAVEKVGVDGRCDDSVRGE